MPDIMEISGVLSKGLAKEACPGGLDLRDALALATIRKLRRARRVRRAKVRRVAPRPRRLVPAGMTAERALELAERFLRENRKPLAIAWARQAENRAKAEGKSAIVRRAQEIIKTVRGEAVAALLGGQLHDIDGIVMGRLMGIW